MNYSNPRMTAEFTDWPLGGDRRGRAIFNVETKPGHGQRATRTTENPKTGKLNKPKAGVYSPKVRIVDGDDGRTYVASLTMYRSISIMEGNLQFQADSIHDKDERYAELLKLFD